MDIRTLERRLSLKEAPNGVVVALTLHGEIGVLSCEVDLTNDGLIRAGVNAPYRGNMRINAYIHTHRHYARHPLEKKQEQHCTYLNDGHCYGAGKTDSELAYRFVSGDVAGLWRRMEMIYERWWRSVKNDSETEDLVYMEDLN